jgi:F0F1-type ATP synthase membrane subunit b/b'
VAETGQNGSNNVVQFGGAADRAGAIVTEHVRSIIEAAEVRAEDIRNSAEEDARRTREAASEAATAVLKRIDEMGEPLAALARDLRSEAERLQARVVEHERPV